MNLILIHIAVFIINISTGEFQKKKYVTCIIAFYNVENLFDTVDDPETLDEDYTLSGKNHYSVNDYSQKISQTAQVISEIGTRATVQGPALIGLAEIENYRVLQDLVRTEALQDQYYQIIHQDSPDRRGIDVALLYQPALFNPIETETLELRLWNEEGARIYTRDILYVKGILEDEVIHVFVNHWPSRRGGKTRSHPKRMKAAYLVQKKSTQILLEDTDAKILIMGDFNDDPTDKSIKTGLMSSMGSKNEEVHNYFNPMEKMHKKGMNTLAYRDGLNLFDQIIISKSLLFDRQSPKGLFFRKAGIYNPAYLISQQGKYKGYPMRSFQNNSYAGGYSDHFPVFIELLKPLSSD